MSAGAAETAAAPLGSAKKTVLRPRDAATMIVIDQSGAKPRVLMGRRSEKVAFMPGIFVFPGGRVDACDRRMNAFGMLADHVETRLLARVQRPTPGRARALAMAAIRELAEETGLLLGSREAGAPNAPSREWRVFEEHGVYPSLEGIAFIARALTPPGRVRRFDTRFFAADAGMIAGRIDGLVGPDAELTELAWLTFDEALSLELHHISRKVIGYLEQRLETGLDRDGPVPYFFRKGAKQWCEELR